MLELTWKLAGRKQNDYPPCIAGSFGVFARPVVPSLPSGDRFALVIGNAKYPDADAPLKEPVSDARNIADELKRDGFTVETGENLTGDGMRKALERLYGHIKPGTVSP